MNHRFDSELITFSGLDGGASQPCSSAQEKRGAARRVSVSTCTATGVYAAGPGARRAARRDDSPAEGDEDGKWPFAARPLGYGGARPEAGRGVNAAAVRLPLRPLIFLGYRLYVERVRRRVLIMDRYFYDTLVDVAAGGGLRGARLLALVTPTPHVPIYLDISPEQAYARKGDHNVAYLGRRRDAYRSLFPVGGAASSSTPAATDSPSTRLRRS